MRGNSYIRGLGEDARGFEKDDAERMKIKFFEDAEVINGICKWKMGNFPPTDILEFWHYLGYEFDYEATLKAREEDDAKFIAAYRKRMANHVPSGEELYEMQAAFGKGTTVVDVISGRKYKI